VSPADQKKKVGASMVRRRWSGPRPGIATRSRRAHRPVRGEKIDRPRR